jgi:glycosyltransferase involved in cell wall biosynthesis
MRVLALASYPNQAAATRYRVTQFIAPLAERGITMTLHPFFDSKLFTSLYKREAMARTALGLTFAGLRRLKDVWHARKADVLFVQREAMMFGPPLIEWLSAKALRRPMVLDLDDATYVRYTSPTYGRLASALKCFGKTDSLIRWAKVVTCGNQAIAEYVSKKGGRAVVIPTVVDTEQFRPPDNPERHDVPVLGWLGTHSTYPFLESIFPALEQLSRTHRFRLKIVGAGREQVMIPGVEIENLGWRLEREIADLQSFDIGLYPVRPGGSTPSEWTAGKSGFKSVQYMAVGIPYVVTPIGACAEIGEPGVTHFVATSQDEWYEALARLLSDNDLRKRMGEAGRQHALLHYPLSIQAEKLARALQEASSK